MPSKQQPRAVCKTPRQPRALLRVLDEIVFPSFSSWSEKNFLVAQPTHREFLQNIASSSNPVTTSARDHPGRRVAVRGAGPYRESARPTARWPETRLITAVVPMLIIPVSGQVDFRLSDYTVHLHRGQFCLLPPDVPRIGGDPRDSHIEPPRGEDEQCDLLWLRPREGAIEGWICHSHGKRHESGSELMYVHHPEALSYFTTILQESTMRAPGWGEVCKSLLSVILTIVRRELAADTYYGDHQRLQHPAEVAPLHDVITSAQMYVQDHLSEPLTINDVARACYISRTQFTLRFREETGQSFTEYLTQCRIERAKALLHDTNWPIQRVASMVGVTPTHLRNLFARYLGKSPREFQQEAHSSGSKPAEYSRPNVG